MPLRIRFSIPRAMTALLVVSCIAWISAAAANQLIIQPGDIECTIDPEVPVVIDEEGDIHVRVSNAESCLPQNLSPPATPSLSLEVLDATAPGRVRLSWTGSSGAESCTARSTPTVSGWNGSVSTGSGNTRTLDSLAAGSYEFGLTCTNAAGESDEAVVNAAISGSGSTACATRPPPQGWTRLTSSCRFIIGSGWQGTSCTAWNDIYDRGFTEVSGSTERIATNRQDPSQYLALQFTTGNISPTDRGSVTSDSAGSMMTYRNRIYSISTCPGDFNQEAIMEETGCYGQMSKLFHIRWGGENSGRSCVLQPNTTYYLNLISTSSAPGTAPDDLVPNCPSGTNCGAVYEPQQGN